MGKAATHARDANQASPNIGTADIFWMSIYIIGIALIPIIVFVAIGLLCVLLSRGA